MKTIIKMAQAKDPFSRVLKSTLDDPRLSWKAKGIVAYLGGKPDGWKMRVADLVNHSTDGKSAIRAALNELRETGYAQLSPIRETGRIREWVWKISDSPIFAPDTDFQDVEIQDVENRHHSKNQSLQRKIPKKKNKGASAMHDVFSPKFPYPETEEECYEVLEMSGVEIFPNHDGNFFNTMERTGWKIRGKPIFDWIATYQARTKVTTPGRK